MARTIGAVVVVTAATSTACNPDRAGRACGSPHDRVVVTAQAANAVIHRTPFNLRIENRSGRPVLREVAGGSAPLSVGPVADPVAPGFDSRSVPTLYAPLHFLVGSESIQQYDGSIWGGNLQSGQRSGTEYSARAVRRARRSGNGVVLTVATDDPSGRRLRVRVAPMGCCAIGVHVSPRPRQRSRDLGRLLHVDTRRGVLRLRGPARRARPARQRLLQLRQGGEPRWPDGHRTGGAGTSLYPNGPAAAYYPQPVFVHAGLRVPARPAGAGALQLDDDDPIRVERDRLRVAARYVVAPGAARQAIRTLTALTGRQPVPPVGRWARCSTGWSRTSARPRGLPVEVRADIRNIDRYRLPLTAYRIEGWGFPGGRATTGCVLHTWVHAPASRRR